MLTASQISALRDRSEQLLDPITDFLIEDIAERVKEAGQLTGTASYDVWRLQQLGVSQKKLKKEIAKRLKVSQKEAGQLLTQAAETGYNYDISRFPTAHAIPLSANSSVQQILDATVKQAKDDLTNITQTIGFVGSDGVCRELTDAYNQACDFAFQKVSLGAQDFNSAVRAATANLAQKGIRYIDYESGVHTSLEAAVRRNIMGGLGIMQNQISQQNHDYLGCDGWEISAHHGSAPDHEPYQGKQYPDKEYQRLNGSLVRPIGELNCGHAASPIIMGVNDPQYTPEELEDMRQENEEGVTFEGKHYTLYEASQRQRKFETTIRNQKRKILIDEVLGDTDKLQQDQIRLQVLKHNYARFSKGVGLPMQHTRMETSCFDWKKGKTAEEAAKVAEKGGLPDTKKKAGDKTGRTESANSYNISLPKSIAKENVEISSEHDIIEVSSNTASTQSTSLTQKTAPRKVYTKRQLSEMPIEDLRVYTIECATEWYESGRSGISFPPGKDMREAAEQLAQGASKTSLQKDAKALQERLLQLDAERAGNVVKNAAGQTVTVVSSPTLSGIPNSITQTSAKKGNITRNYYDEKGRQSKQVSNDDHGEKDDTKFGKNGEHAHDYKYSDDGELIERHKRDLTAAERKENADIL